MPPTPLQVGILSPGAMGSALASYLSARGIAVHTTVADRSAASRQRAESSGMRLQESDDTLVAACDVLLSIVPPRDAVATAERVAAVLLQHGQRETPLHYLDLNAVSPGTARGIAAVLAPLEREGRARFSDGGIVGPPPVRSDAGWKVPSIPVSGPWTRELPGELLALDPHLFKVYRSAEWEEVGTASALKCCFASLTKGTAALGVQSFATARRAGVVGELKEHLEGYAPELGRIVERGVVGAKGKAWRWVAEMEEIADGARDVGGWEAEQGGKLFDQIARIYEVLGDVGGKDGENLEEVVDGVVKALKQKRRNTQEQDGKNVD